MKGWWIATGIIGIAALGLALGLGLKYDDLPVYWQGVAVEAAGVFLEIVLLVAAFGGYEQWRRRRDDQARLRERIEDVKHINDPHAHGIIASSIRGLARFGIFNVDLRGVQLTNFSFERADITSLAGAVFADGLYLNKPSRNFTSLKEVKFTWVDCTGTIFGKGNLSLAKYEDCDFWAATLRNASFDSATLKWTPDKIIADEGDWFEYDDRAEDGTPIPTQTYSPAFDGADLAQCSFKGCTLANADFRRAKNVRLADFSTARGLETCYFDEGDRPVTI